MFIYTRKQEWAVFWKWSAHSLNAKTYEPSRSLDGARVGGSHLHFFSGGSCFTQSSKPPAYCWTLKICRRYNVKKDSWKRYLRGHGKKKTNQKKIREKKHNRNSLQSNTLVPSFNEPDWYSLYSNTACFHAVCSVTLPNGTMLEGKYQASSSSQTNETVCRFFF